MMSHGRTARRVVDLWRSKTDFGKTGQDRLGSGDCERVREGLVAQPVNTATSAFYIVAGMFAAGRPVDHSAPTRTTQVLFGGLVALVGVGSIAFHGPQPRGAELMHDVPIAAVAGVVGLTPVVRTMRRREPLPGWTAPRAALLLAVTACAGAAFAAGRTDSRACRPDSLIQWHGVWHIASAAGFVLAGDILFRESPARTAGERS
jgi:hypothetical protein